MPAGNDFAGLHAIGQAIGRAVAVLLMLVIGACVGAVIGGLATFYCYFIGIYLGLPIGVIVGTVVGLKTPLVDAVFVFGTTVTTWVIGDLWYQAMNPVGVDGFLYGVVATLAGALVAIVGLLGRHKLPEKVRIIVGIATAGGPAIWAIVSFLQAIYR
jgi:hypothetical protein